MIICTWNLGLKYVFFKYNYIIVMNNKEILSGSFLYICYNMTSFLKLFDYWFVLFFLEKQVKILFSLKVFFFTKTVCLRNCDERKQCCNLFIVSSNIKPAWRGLIQESPWKVMTFLQTNIAEYFNSVGLITVWGLIMSE